MGAEFLRVPKLVTDDPLRFVDAHGWRDWLRANHAMADEAWVMIYKKHSSTPSITLVEATEEALCFGWIDSSMQSIDDERYALRYTPRRQGSAWSPRMKQWAMKLIEQGRMTEAGLAKIEEAKRNGHWDKARGGVPPHTSSPG
jgi:uncharacterized protein YdeI (YjbR/CyaY-like superfamily)